MSLKLLDKLSKDFTELLDDKEDYNVIIEVENKKSFTAHSTILRHRSSYFCEELTKVALNKNNIKILVKPDISANFIEIILKYIYGGIVNLEDVDNRFIFDLMIFADEHEFEELTKQLESFLIENRAFWLRTHFSFVYHSIFRTHHFTSLKQFCNDIVVKYPNIIFDAMDFVSLKESALVSLLERDDLQVEEIEIWKKVIQWGIAQHNDLPQRPEEWTEENFLTLRTTLKNCLPHIRYFQISNLGVWENVKPYKKILDKQLWNDLKQHLIIPDRPVTSVVLPARSVIPQELPDRKEPFFSTILTFEHVAEISAWVDRESTNNGIPYKFELILRGSRDGFHPQTFWNMCHGHSNTVAILKVAGTDEILGGYNPLAWDKTTDGTWISTDDSFIFSLKNGSIKYSILSRVRNTKYAVYNCEPFHRTTTGLHFGSGELKMKTKVLDFSRDKHSYCRGPYFYEKTIRRTSEYFSVVDYEVFRLVKF